MALLDFTNAPHGGRLRLLPESTTQLRIAPRVLLYHSIVGSAEGAYSYFRTHSNLESHFIVTSAGEIWQLVDTERRADANYQANQFAVSVETEDGGDPDTQPWTPAQLESLVWLARECHRLHRIPLAQVPRWDGAGIGFHTMFGAPSPYTPVAKTCPGRVRIDQFHRVLLPRITAPEEDIMAGLTEEDLKRIVRGIVREELNLGTGEGQKSWAGTSIATLDGVQRTFSMAGANGAVLEKVRQEMGTVLGRIRDELGRHGQLLDGLVGVRGAPTELLSVDQVQAAARRAAEAAGRDQAGEWPAPADSEPRDSS